MEETMGVSTLPARRRGPGEADRKALADGLAQTKRQIDQAYSCFDTADDPDLIDSYVFEINALQARYNYLLRRLKELEGAV